MASWQMMRCMKTKPDRKKTKQTKQIKAKHFLLFCFSTNKQECSTETGMEGET